MSRRLQPTLLDYMVVAINPALIMVLIGSLVYFVLEMFYQGQYPERLHFCLTMFIFGAVLVARISMESGLERAAPFGVILALLMCVAMSRFVEYKDASVAQYVWIINYGLIGLILWCAYKLTWDCTLMDEMQDASGEGLLQTARLDSTGHDTASKVSADEKSLKDQTTSKRRTKKEKAEIPTDALAPSEKKPDKRQTWWQRFLEHRRRPHAPGLWVVYFSIAALPMFGIGQVFIPVENTGSRRYAFGLLCVYVACGLGLLLTTSFLGLRRYLRQRRLEMPVAMAGTWLTIGALLIASILIITALLPRPNAEYAISQLPWQATSEEHDSSKFAVGHEGTIDEHAQGGSGTRQSMRGEKQDVKPGGAQPTDHPASGSNQSSDQSPSKQPSSQPTDQPSNSSSQHESENQNSKSQDSDSQAAAKGSSSQGEGKAEASKSPSNKSQSGNSNPSNQSQTESAKSPEQQASQSNPQPQESSPAEASPPEAPSSFSNLTDWLAPIAKWIFYGAVVLLALWWLWSHPGAFKAWLQSLLSGWRNFWRNLFGGQHRKSEIAISAMPRKSFLDYSNPFSSGMASRASAQELVRYSFEALEAWARDNNCLREAEQTPLEFARQLGGHAKHLQKPAYALAELYSISAYSPAALPASSMEHLQRFWQTLQQEWAMV